jgi:hypothetical protein
MGRSRIDELSTRRSCLHGFDLSSHCMVCRMGEASWRRNCSNHCGNRLRHVVCTQLFLLQALSEVVASHVLLPGLFLGMFGQSEPNKRLFWTSCFYGLAASFRMQLLPTTFVAIAYFCRPGLEKKVTCYYFRVCLPHHSIRASRRNCALIPFSIFLPQLVGTDRRGGKPCFTELSRVTGIWYN